MFKKRQKDHAVGGDWITIYADMVTLLLCFFILLYSFSALDVDKFKMFIQSFQGKGILDGGTIILPGPGTDFPIDPGDDDEDDPYWADTETLYNYIKAFLIEQGIDGKIELAKEERGVQLMMPDHLLFNSGQASITSQGMIILNLLVPLMDEIPNRVLVEGHTDNVPINNPVFPSNWELSSARSARVVRFFVENNRMNPKRFVVIGYGECHPIASNDTPEGRAKNRRVVMIIRSK